MRLRLLFMIVLLLPIVSAIGIGPSKRTLDYEGSYSGEFTNIIINNAGTEVSIRISFEGILAPYVINAPVENIVMQMDERAEFSFGLDIEGDLPPGRQELKIIAREVEGRGDAAVTSRASVESSIYFNVPTPGKYIEASFTAPTVQVEEPITFLIRGANRGLGPIDTIWAELELHEHDIKIKTDEIGPLDTHEEFELTAVLDDPTIKPGEHPVTAFLYYDEKLLELPGTFQVGDLEVEILSFSQEATTGEINKLSLNARSLWDETVPDAVASVIVSNSEGDTVSTGTSAELNMEPWSPTQFEIFADFSNAKPGSYEAEYNVDFAGKQTSEFGTFTVNEIIEEPSPVKGILTITNLLVTLIVLFVLFILLLLFRKPKQ